MSDPDKTPSLRPFSPEWFIEMFGEPYPPEVVDLLFNRHNDHQTVGQVREEVLRLAAQRWKERNA